jgi:Protein of unknown function (DUF2905)
MARVLIVIGLGCLLAGLALKFAPGALSWFGRLPGDIDIHRGNTRIFIPVTSMIIVSLLVTLFLNLLRK